MKLEDDRERFGAVSVALHWTVAIIVVAMLCIAIYASQLPRDDGRNLRFLHMSLGLLLVPVLAARIGWRALQGKPVTRHHHRAERALAAFSWRFLLWAPVVLLATGPFLAWLHERPVGFFGLFEIASPVARDRELRKTLVMPLHAFFGYSLAAVITLHVAGALKHLLVYRDGVAERMLRPNFGAALPKTDSSPSPPPNDR